MFDLQVMDGEVITAMRTAAVSAISAKALQIKIKKKDIQPRSDVTPPFKGDVSVPRSC